MATPMPQPTQGSAPRWDGDPNTLQRFLTVYHQMATDAQLTDLEAIKNIISYITEPRIRMYITNYEEFHPQPANANTPAVGNWAAFKTRLLKDFPRVDEVSGFTRQQFQDYAIRCAQGRRVRTEDELEEFQRELRCYSTLLMRDGHLSVAEVSAVFQQVMYQNWGEIFRQELHRKERKQVYTIEEVYEAAKIVIRMESADRALYTGNYGQIAPIPMQTASSMPAPVPIAQPLGFAALPPIPAYGAGAYPAPTQPQYSLPAPAAPQAPVKTEDATLQQILLSIQALTLQLSKQGNDTAASSSSAPRKLSCYYCHGPHLVYDCETRKTDIDTGRAVLNGEGRIVYPTGERVGGDRNVSLAIRIDTWNKQHPDAAKKKPGSGPAIASAMLLQATVSNKPPLEISIPTFETEEAEATWHQMAALKVLAYQQRKGLRSQGPVDATKPDAPANGHETPPHVGKEPVAKPAKGKPYTPVDKADAAAKESSSQIARRAFPSATIEEVSDEEEPVKKDAAAPLLPIVPARPQFKIQSPLENEGLGKLIAQRILDSNVVMTVSEVLALSPSVRKYWKDNTGARRATVTFAEGTKFDEEETAQVFKYRVIEEDNASQDQIVGAHILPLRYLDCRIDRIEAEGIVDGGAQIIIISQRLWEDLGRPIDPHKTMSLEAANATTAQTLGLLADLRVQIGGIDFYLQAHVVDEAPFDLLLGRPFLALARTREDTREDGCSTMTLHDPNSDRAVILPTKERIVRPKTPTMSSSQGF